MVDVSVTRAAVAEQKIPLKLTLASNEVSALSMPPAIYVMACRQAYLPCIAKAAFPHFQKVLPPGDDHPWFDFNGVPLKWHIPVGALYDLMHPSTPTLPWNLTVHYRSFPEATLLRCDDDTAPRDAFFNALKEAAFVLTGSATSVMTAGSLRDTLWQQVAASQVEEFGRSIESLNLVSALRGEKQPRVPVKLMVTRIPPGACWSWEFTRVTSIPTSTVDRASGATVTLADALAEWLPKECFPLGPRETAAGSDEASPSQGQAPPPVVAPPAAAPQELESAARDGEGTLSGETPVASGPADRPQGNTEGLLEQPTAAVASSSGAWPPPPEHPREAPSARSLPRHMRVKIAGIEPPPCAPLVWLHTHLKHFDHFLYVSVHLTDTAASS